MTDHRRVNGSEATGLTVMFTCVGRRVSLVRAFRRAMRRLRVPGRIVGAETSQLSAAWHCCDERLLVPPTGATDYVPVLLRIVRRLGVDLLIPTVDLDLPVLAAARETFLQAGCRVLVSSPKVVSICQDKRKTVRFLQEHGFGCPATASARSVLRRSGAGRAIRFPCVLKPWDGSASKDLTRVGNRRELAVLAGRVRHGLCQEYVAGREFTCDVYVDYDGEVRCVVPRERLEVRAGEVSKARVVLDEALIAEVARLVRTLGAGPGVVTVQVIRTDDGKLRFIEINPRFGGGVPLALKAGAPLARWILQEALGRRPRFEGTRIRDGLVMLRYDDEIWYSGD